MSLIEQLQADCGYDPEGDSPVDALIGYKDALEDLLGSAEEQLERRAAEAFRARNADDQRWQNGQVAQDTEEAEASGHLIGREEALQEALAVLRGTSPREPGPLAAPMARAAEFAEEVRGLERRMNEAEAGEDLGFDVTVKPDRMHAGRGAVGAFVEVVRVGSSLEPGEFAELRLLAEERFGTVQIRARKHSTEGQPRVEILARFAGGGDA